MLVEVIEANVPHLVALGQTQELPDDQARALIMLGKVKAAEQPAPPARRYNRRDMQVDPEPDPSPKVNVPEKPPESAPPRRAPRSRKLVTG